MLFLLFLSTLLSVPAIQTELGSFVSEKLNEEFDTDISIKKIDLSFFGDVKLEGIEIRDHHNDTLIFINALNTSLSNVKSIINNEVKLGSVSIDEAYFYMKTYKGEKDDSLTVFVDSFEDDEPRDSLYTPFVLSSSSVYINNLKYKLQDFNNKTPLIFSANRFGGNLQNMLIYGPNFSTNIRGVFFEDNRGLKVTNLSSDFYYTKTSMDVENLILQTDISKISSNINFKYKRKDLADFYDKVNIIATFSDSRVGIRDLKKFYKELNGDDIISFESKLKGRLNNFSLEDLIITSDYGIKITGDLDFENAVNVKRGFNFAAKLDNLTASYENLKNILPNVLGNTLPSEFSKFGQFVIDGQVEVSPKNINSIVSLESKIGTIISDLQIFNIETIDNASYSGEIELVNFDIGELFGNKLFNKVSLHGDVIGRGFKLDNIKTSFIGAVSGLDFKGYRYRNIEVNGEYQNNKFDGELEIDDENFIMRFNGLADLSSDVYNFDFRSDIDYLNLKETNLFTRDSISVLKGNIILDIEGNNLDDIAGEAVFKNVLYTNEIKEYNFKEFNINSYLSDDIRSIIIDSQDIANGYLLGKFSFEDLIPISQNILGSNYSNYKPYKVGSNQFLNFNFTIYNQIVTVFFSDIYIDNNIKINGVINPDKNQLKLSVLSPKLNAYDLELNNLLLEFDNQKRQKSLSLTASEANTDYYNISKLQLQSVSKKDTMFFKSVFYGGKNKDENFNLDFYYTLNEDEKSVVGIENSSFKIRENRWSVKLEERNSNKITFDLKENEYDFNKFKLESGDQKIEFKGSLKGETEKEFLTNFTKVKLQSFLPKIDSLDMKGTLSGRLDFIQRKGQYKPEALLSVQDFEVNNFKQGDLDIKFIGNNSYKDYKLDMSIKNNLVKSIAAKGSLDFSSKRPLIELNVYLEEFGLRAFSPLGKDVLSSIRGNASGSFSLKGFLGNPKMEGKLTLKDAGLKFSYLNVDYNFEGDSYITLQDQSFVFENIILSDSKHNTKGKLIGDINHSHFENWYLNLEILSDNLLVLDTKKSEEAFYYGSAFINGRASIKGLIDQITIDLNAKTMPNTFFVVPLKDIETADSFQLIHFQSDEIKASEKQEKTEIESLNTLSLNVDLEVTKDATVQVVIDEIYGSQLSGNGTGNLRLEVDTRGKFNVFGDYIIDSGIYDFKYGGVINKPFLIQKGGTVSWSGDPYKAILNVTAVYKTTANPGVLLQNISSNRKINVDLIAIITGDLFRSKQELDIQLINVDSTISSELEFILNDNNINEKTTQFISLLTFGSFVNLDNINFDLSNTASSAISNAFSRLLNNPNSKFRLGVDYQQGVVNDVERLNTDDQVDVSIVAQLSDRIIINGKAGVPVGAETQSGIVGDVKVEIMLNKEGSLKGTIFNRPNEIQYSVEEEGYTRGAGLSYQVSFNNLKDLFKKIKRKKKKNNPKLLIKKDTIQKQNSIEKIK